MGKDLYEVGEIPPIGEVPRQMHAQLVRPDRYGEPGDAICDEVIDVPELGPHDALVMVMAAGVNFNNVWAARGVPGRRDEDPGALGRADRVPHRRLGRVRGRVRRRLRGHEREGRRPGRRARRPVGPRRPLGHRRRRPRARAVVPRVGLRLVLGLVLAVLQGPGPPVPAEGRAPHVGAGCRADAHGLDRLPDAPRLAAEHGEAGGRRARMGRLRRARLARGAARHARRRHGRGGREQRREGRVREGPRRRRVHRPQGLHALGRAAGVGLARVEDVVRGREGVRQGDLGGARREAQSRTSCSTTRGRTRSRPRSSCASAAAWS